MAITFKKNPKYPSTQKPGIFYNVDGQESTWELYTGIDETEINKFKFSLGTWMEFRRYNRELLILPIEELDNFSLIVAIEATEEKPTEAPDGYVENTKENAENPLYGNELEPDESDISELSAGETGTFISPGRAWKTTVEYDESTDDDDPESDGQEGITITSNPRLDSTEFINLNLDGTLSQGQQWRWNGRLGSWEEAQRLVRQAPNNTSTDNEYVGIANLAETGYSTNLTEENLLIYHPLESENYKNTSAPLEVNFALAYNNLDTGQPIYYHVLEWGDEENKLTNDQILNSEFFGHYEIDDDDMLDRTQMKKLYQTLKLAKKLVSAGDATELSYTKHNYTEPGVKSIKTVVFRYNDDETYILETMLVITNIVVNNPNTSITDFNMFNSTDFSVLPLNTETDELIIGGVDEKSNYVESIEKIERDDLYETEDYLEKKYINKFLQKIDNLKYGNHPGKLDLASTRLFTKPYDISYFLNSRSTDILIDNKDCVVELNPNEIDQGIIDNTGKSNENAILIGDYKLVKKEKEKLRKDDNMDIPRIQTDKENQAF